MKIGGGSGCLLVAGEAFGWRPWEASAGRKGNMVNNKGQWDAGDEAWGVLELVWPKPGTYHSFSRSPSHMPIVLDETLM